MNEFQIPVLGFCAYSGSGKTTLLVKLLPLLKQKGIRIAMIKHAHHDFDIDKPGKDSYELRKAGADQILIASSQRSALITETPGEEDPLLSDLVQALDLEKVDLGLVEGFRHVAFPKIELHRPSLGKDLIYPDDSNVIAIATDADISCKNLTHLDINKPEEIAAFISQWLNKSHGERSTV